MAGPLDGYTPSAGGPLAGYTPSGGAPKPAPGNNSNSWTSWLTSPQFANESLLNEAKDVGLSGSDYLTLGAVKKLAPASWGVEQAHSNLGLADYGLGAAAYALGPGKVLAPLAASAKLGALGTAALEGAMAGGASSAIADPTDPMGVAIGAGMGGALGGAAGGLGKAAGTVAGRFAPAVDPAAAVASTKAARDAAYAPLRNIHFDPNDITGAYRNATLTPGMAADVSPGFNSTVSRQMQAIQNGGLSANDIADYARNIRDVGMAPGASNGDRALSGQIADNLEGVLGTATPVSGHPVGQAADVLSAAKQAHQNYAMAQNLKEWADNLNDFKASLARRRCSRLSIIRRAVSSTKRWRTLQRLAPTAAAGSPIRCRTLPVRRLELAGVAAGASGPVVAGLGAAGHLAKIPIKGLVNLCKRANLRNQLQQAYPSLTGVQPPPSASPWGPSAPSAGDLIKALALSQASQAGI